MAETVALAVIGRAACSCGLSEHGQFSPMFPVKYSQLTSILSESTRAQKLTVLEVAMVDAHVNL